MLVQFLNALSPMLMTLPDIVIFVLDALSGGATLMRFLHPLKAKLPMLVTLSDIVTFFRLLQPEKASLLIAVPVTVKF